MQLRSGTAVLWRGPGSVQVGSDPDHHLIFRDLTMLEQMWLIKAGEAATSPSSVAHEVCTMPHQLDAPDDGLDQSDSSQPFLPPDMLEMVAQLYEADFLVRTDTPAHNGNTRHPTTLPYESTGDTLLSSDIGVIIDGIDRTTMAMVDLLISSGIRRFEFRDTRVVDTTIEDLLPPGSYAASRKHTFTECLRSKRSDIFIGALSSPSIAVVSTSRCIDLVTSGLLLAEDQPHLLLTQNERSITVGPLVLPGSTPCANCLALQLSDNDPTWPSLSAQMRQHPLPAPHPASVHVAALECARAVLTAVGINTLGRTHLMTFTDTTQLGQAIVETITNDGFTSSQVVRAHPRCGCGAAGIIPFVHS